jgi:hypothetical protein
VESLRKKRDERMASVIDDDTSQLSKPKFAIDDVVYYYKERKWLIGRVRNWLIENGLLELSFNMR